MESYIKLVPGLMTITTIAFKSIFQKIFNFIQNDQNVKLNVFEKLKDITITQLGLNGFMPEKYTN